MPHRLNRLKAFTLVELLVVLTIIVVLLALLVPAIDRARYQAELVVCGTRMKGTASGSNTYAVDHKRLYPQRDVIDLGRSDQAVHSQPIVLASGAYDDRARIEPYMPMKLLGEAAAEPVSLQRNEALGLVFSGYSLYFGVRFEGQDKGMRKIGDRFAFTDGLTGQTHEYNLLAADLDIVFDTLRYVTSHPDSLPAIPAWRVFNHPDYGTFSRYDNLPAGPFVRRGTLEQNYAYADGSVVRLHRVEVDDERTATVSYRVVPGWSEYPGARVQLPRE